MYEDQNSKVQRRKLENPNPRKHGEENTRTKLKVDNFVVSCFSVTEVRKKHNMINNYFFCKISACEIEKVPVNNMK